MKRHYEIMRIMRTKILNMRELLEGAQGIIYIYQAVVYRVQGLTSVLFLSSAVACYVNLIYRQLHSAETRSRETVPKFRFWDCGLFIVLRVYLPSNLLVIMQFKYYHNENALWSMDYIRGLNPQITPYNDEDEDQNIQPGDILNHEYKDELCLDYSVYDGHSTDHVPICRDVDSPMKDMYDLCFYLHAWRVLIFECPAVWGPGMAIFTMMTESIGERMQ